MGINFGLRNTDPKSIVFDQQELNENNGGFSTRQLNGGRDQIDVDLPACGGVQSCGVDKVVHFRARSMGVIVDSENTKTFSYTDPYIDELSVYPPANAGESGREVEARGWSFCESTACASLLFSRTNDTWTQISHEHAAVNPHGILSFHVSGYNGYVKVRVNGKCGAPPNTVDCQRDSNEVYFRTLSPVVDSATVNMLKCRRFNTNGGETVDVVGTNFGDGSALAVFVGGLPATIVTGPTPTGAVEDTLIVSTMTVEIPPNVGAAHYLVVKLDSVASSVLGDAPIVRYRTPYITKVEVNSTNAYLAHLHPSVLSNDPGIENPTAWQRLTDAKVGRSGVSWPGGRGQADTMGSTVTITGRNFGAASMGGWVDYEYAGYDSFFSVGGDDDGGTLLLLTFLLLFLVFVVVSCCGYCCFLLLYIFSTSINAGTSMKLSMTSGHVTAWNHDKIVVRMPAGEGKDHRFGVNVGTCDHCTTSANNPIGRQTTSFMDPYCDQSTATGNEIKAACLTMPDSDKHQYCKEGEDVQPQTTVRIDYGIPYVTTVQVLTHVGTEGGGKFAIQGGNFGDGSDNVPIVSLINTHDSAIKQYCVVDGWNDHSINVTVPEFAGLQLQIEVSVADQSGLYKGTPSYPGVDPKFVPVALQNGFSYAPPVLNSMSPTSGSTSGYNADGNRVLVTLKGSDFGDQYSDVIYCASELPGCTGTATGYPQSMYAFVPSSDFIYRSHTTLAFYLPQGTSDSVSQPIKYMVYASGRRSATHDFSYYAPRIERIYSPDCDCALSPESVVDGTCVANDASNRTFGPGKCPTGPTDGCSIPESLSVWRANNNGGQVNARGCVRPTTIVIEGDSFGSKKIQNRRRLIDANTDSDANQGGLKAYALLEDLSGNEVSRSSSDDIEGCDQCKGTFAASGALCCEHTHTRIVLKAPKGLGKALQIVMVIGGVRSNPVSYRYFAPALTSSSPTTLDARGQLGNTITIEGETQGETLYLYGDNLGHIPSPVTIRIGTQECLNAQWNANAPTNGKSYLTCNPGLTIVGPKNITLTVANQTITESLPTTDIFSSTALTQFMCKDGARNVDGSRTEYFGRMNQLCVPCPVGAICKSDWPDLKSCVHTICGKDNVTKIEKCVDDWVCDPYSQPGFFRLTLSFAIPDDENIAKGLNERKAIGPRCNTTRYETSFTEKFPNLKQKDWCYDFRACSPKESCVGSNFCGKEYQYLLPACEDFNENNPTKMTCSNDNDCMTRHGGPVRLPGAPCDKKKPGDCAVCDFSGMDNTGKGTLVVNMSLPMNQTLKRVGVCKCQPGPRCAMCTEGFLNRNGKVVNGYFRQDNACVKCPENPELLIAAFVCVVVIMAVGGYVASSNKVNLSFLIIGYDYLQVLFLFSAMKINWPPVLLEVFRALSIFSFNIDFAAPECILTVDFTYEQMWWAQEILPFLVMGLLFIVWCVKVLLKIMKTSTHGKQKLFSHSNQIIAVGMNFIYFYYLTVVRKALDVFNCMPTDPDDGFKYTEFTSIECGGGKKCFPRSIFLDSFVADFCADLC